MGYIFLREEVGLYWEDYSQITQDVLMAVMAWLNPVP